MANVAIPPELEQDPQGVDQPGLGLGRDPARTPLAWDASEHGGFTTATPWLPLHADYKTINVDAEEADPTSMLTLHRRLIALRRSTPALATGKFTPVATEDELLVYLRGSGGERCLVALNLGATVREVRGGGYIGGGRIALSTYLDREGAEVGVPFTLRPDEGVIVTLATAAG